MPSSIFSVPIRSLENPFSNTLYFTGPSQDTGPLPAIFYFALSGEESLILNPYNQPVAALTNEPIRIFSLTLPFHGDGFDKFKAISHRADAIEASDPCITQFIDNVVIVIDYLIETKWIDPKHLGVAGLSRGVLIATHVAARHNQVNTVLGFAPLINLALLNEFEHLQDNNIVKSLNLMSIIEPLPGKKLRFYISNRDTRVNTDEVFHFIRNLTEANYRKNTRSPQVEMFISPPTGHQGHGTPPHLFHDGANWLKKQIVG